MACLREGWPASNASPPSPGGTSCCGVPGRSTGCRGCDRSASQRTPWPAETNESAAALLALADEAGLTHLRSVTLDYIAHNYMQVAATQVGWQGLVSVPGDRTAGRVSSQASRHGCKGAAGCSTLDAQPVVLQLQHRLAAVVLQMF